ncbi:metallophosphoesterase [Roseomonas sp. NAR14]|uniref:Metallophosphoesterase n=1 Tax=Roseomonas acroporae TaxID=2937791 RepID=A0A9X1Y4R7_9PROT|nr:metallophosphoesterase [Roseomonas acroporae]MCK8783924.1 metallophosphoesterase [Roseomonas acroporae]
MPAEAAPPRHGRPTLPLGPPPGPPATSGGRGDDADPLPTRRRLLGAGRRLAIAALAAGGTTAAYALAIEPAFRLVVREYRLSLPGWGARPPLSLCLLADPHCGGPWMPLARLHRIVALANALRPDLHLLLGDLPAHHRFAAPVPMDEAAAILSGLRAPLGTLAVLGNHDWWDDAAVQRRRAGRPAIEARLRRAGIPVLANAACRLAHGDGIWLCGTDSMLPYRAAQHLRADDLPATLAQLRDDAPAILLAHEPDLFPEVPARIALTLSGHTHGGQVRLFGHSPVVPSRYGNRYAYGLVEEAGRRLIVSGGLGCSILPVRLGVPPELTLVHLA